MSLYEKYRPKGLKTFMGNEDLKNDLRPFFNGGKQLPHTILLTGPSGAGKTTLARMMARKILGCTDQDIVEYDIGEQRGIDAARAIRRQTWNAPLSGGARAFILDEVHSSTKDFQTAMLKCLEEPPSHVYFFLCTTDPQQLLKTIITRCTEFQVEALGVPELVEIMQRACRGEEVEIDEGILRKIAKQANGSPRGALSLLERLIARDPSEYEAAIATHSDQETQVKDLCQALLTKQPWSVVSKKLALLKEDAESTRRAILGYMQSVLLSGKDSGQAALVMDCFMSADTYRAGMPAITLAAYQALLVE